MENRNELMSYCRILLAKLLIAPSRAFARVFFTSPGFEAFAIGKCLFFGPPKFLELSRRAMDQLSTLDKPLSEAVRRQKLRIWYEPSRIIVHYGLFGVPDSFLAWQEQGLLACILYAHFDARLLELGAIGQAITAEPSALGESVKSPVRAWLETKGFASELVACFC